MSRPEVSRKPEPPTKAPRSSRPLVVGALVLLAGYLLFCHGCHGDVDDELFTSTVVTR